MLPLLIQMLASAVPGYAMSVSSCSETSPTVQLVGAGADAGLRVVSAPASRMGDAVLVSDVVKVSQSSEVRLAAPAKPREGAALTWIAVTVDGVQLGEVLLAPGTCLQVVRVR
jgi:hypothetical protein